MRNHHKLIWIGPVLLLFLLSGMLQAQRLERSLLSNAGDQMESGTVILEWSIGEDIVGDLFQNGYRLGQGFHQGVNLIHRVWEPQKWIYDISLFPNPTVDDLYLQKDRHDQLQLTILDALGRPVFEDSWTGASKSLSLGYLEAGVYLIRFSDETGAYAGYPFVKQ